MINALQAFRGIFAIVIFLGHYPFSGLDFFLKPSDCAVSFYLMASSFVLCFAHEKSIAKHNYRAHTFFFNRLARIYPLHLLCLAIYMLLMYVCNDPKPSGSEFVLNLFLLQSWFPDDAIYFGVNAVSWFLSTLALCYLIFIPIIRLVSKSLQKFIFMFAGVLIAYFILLHTLDFSNLTWAIYIFPPSRVPDFLIGMMLYQIYRTVPSESKVYSLAVKICSLVLLLVFLLIAPYISNLYTLASWWWLPLSLLILSFARSGKRIDTLTKCLDNRFLVWTGNISFSIYMTHTIVIWVLIRAYPKIIPDVSEFISVPLTFGACLVVGYLCSRYFERPVMRLVRRGNIPQNQGYKK